MDFLNQNTTVSKTSKTAVWVLVTGVIMAVLTTVTSHKELFTPQWVAVANVILVFLKNLLDSGTPNT